VRAALNGDRFGLIDNWLRHVQDVVEQHVALLGVLTESPARLDRLCELNVIEQVRHVCQTTIVQDAWSRGQSLAVHGWIYRLDDGLLRDLRVSTGSSEVVDSVYRSALTAFAT
jgi:carbonic anhydrase